MSCMLPTATQRCACYAVFILPNITALLLLAGCRSSQWRRRVRHRQNAQRCRVGFSTRAVMYRRHSLHFVATAPDRWIARGRLWLRRITLAHQQHRPIEQRRQALWPVVALLSAAHHRFRFASRVASVSVRGAGAPRTGIRCCIDPAACDRKCFRPPPIQLPAGQCRSPALRGRAWTTSKCAVLPYGYGVPSPASLVVAPN
jgi:hypothetical protein